MEFAPEWKVVSDDVQMRPSNEVPHGDVLAIRFTLEPIEWRTVVAQYNDEDTNFSWSLYELSQSETPFE